MHDEQRIRFFDMAKGIGILGVVLAHAANESIFVQPSNTAQWAMATCFSFHMPLFFLIAGYFMHPERDFQWRKEGKQLVLTYAITACLVVAGAGVMAKLRHLNVRDMVRFWADAAWYGSGDVSANMLTYAITACLVVAGAGVMAKLRHLNVRDMVRFWADAAWYGSGDVSANTMWEVQGRIGAIWFLLAMFWARLLMHIFARMPYTGCWVAGSFVMGWVSSRSVWLPWSFQSGMCAVAFVYLGVLAKRYDVLGRVRRYPWIWAVAVALWALAIWKFTGFSMAMNNYGVHPVMAAVGSIAGTLCIIGLCQLLDHVQWIGAVLSRAGQATLAILCAHLIEDDVLPWGEWLVTLHAKTIGIPLVAVAFCAHLVIDLLGAWALYYVPVEDDVLPWGEWLVTLHAKTIGIPLVAVAFCAHLVIDLLGAWALYYVPVVNTWFYPTLAKAKEHAKTIGIPLVAVAFCAHLVIDLLGAWALYYVPVVNTWFYPTLAKAKEQAKVEGGRPLAAPAGGGVSAVQ